MLISDSNIFVDRDLCYACGLCVERCILDNLRLSLAPCRTACPLHMNPQGYVRLIAQGREREAAEEMRRYTPFGAILGRVCARPCEAACERSLIDSPVHIRALKRYLAEAHPDVAFEPPRLPAETGKRAAVVGSGPAGLTAAYELRSRGHLVTVFEAAGEVGGLLRRGIPGFRLPKGEVNRAVSFIEALGVKFKTGVAVGLSLPWDELERGFEAVVLAFGAGGPASPNLPGQNLRGVIQGLDLLSQTKDGLPPTLGREVIVIGGGNTAVDAALTCRRVGVAGVKIVCLESRAEMPAFAPAIEEAEAEGVVLDNGWGPTRFLENDRGRIEVHLARCASVTDLEGRFDPVLDHRSPLVLEADNVVLAVGQSLDLPGPPRQFFDQGTGLLAADRLTLQSPWSRKVFVCGDVLTGPSSVAEAMATAKEAALSADRHLRGEGLRWGRDFWRGAFVRDYQSDHDRARGGSRRASIRRPASKRRLDVEVERVLSKAEAKAEAERCLSCGRAFEMNQTCWYCLPCEIECPVDALKVRMPYLVR